MRAGGSCGTIAAAVSAYTWLELVVVVVVVVVVVIVRHCTSVDDDDDEGDGNADDNKLTSSRYSQVIAMPVIYHLEKHLKRERERERESARELAPSSVGRRKEK